jgi:hypothetical protein
VSSGFGAGVAEEGEGAEEEEKPFFSSSRSAPSPGAPRWPETGRAVSSSLSSSGRHFGGPEQVTQGYAGGLHPVGGAGVELGVCLAVLLRALHLASRRAICGSLQRNDRKKASSVLPMLG